jgi:hypothetical protein
MKVRKAEPDSDHFPVDMLMSLTPGPGSRSPSQSPPIRRKYKVSSEFFPDFHGTLAGGQHRELVSFCKSPTTSPMRLQEQSTPSSCRQQKPASQNLLLITARHMGLSLGTMRSVSEPLLCPILFESSSQNWGQARRDYRALTSCKRRRYERDVGKQLCSLASENTARFWKALKSRQLALMITDLGNWKKLFPKAPPGTYTSPGPGATRPP